MKKHYEFPAVLTISCEDDTIYVDFPDLENCFSEGKDINKAIKHAKEALGNVLYWMEKDGNRIPEPSDICDIRIKDHQLKVTISVDMIKVRRSWQKKEEKIEIKE